MHPDHPDSDPIPLLPRTYLRISQTLLAWAALLIFYFACLSHTVLEIDIWHQLALAREIVRCGHVPIEDVFAFTPTVKPAIHHEWGAGMAAYAALRMWGAGGLLAIKYALGFGLLGILVGILRRQSIPPGLMMLCLPVGFILLQRGFTTLRPQMYSLCFTALLLWFLRMDRNGNRGWRYVWPFLFVVWINLHGGFLIAFGLLGAYGLECFLDRRPWRPVAVLLLIQAGLLALTPYGLAYYPFWWHALTGLERQYLTDWRPLYTWWTEGQARFPFVVYLLSAAAAILGFLRAASWPAGRFEILLLGAAAFFCQRLVFFYALAWLAYVPLALRPCRMGKAVQAVWEKYPLLWIIVSLSVFFSFGRFLLARQPFEVLIPGARLERYGDHPIYPVGAADYLRRLGFKGNLMVYFAQGSYVAWNLYPHVRIAADDRYEAAYPEWIIEENFQLYDQAKDYERILAAYRVDGVLVPQRCSLAKALRKDPRWQAVYTDPEYAIYVSAGAGYPLEKHAQVMPWGSLP